MLPVEITIQYPPTANPVIMIRWKVPSFKDWQLDRSDLVELRDKIEDALIDLGVDNTPVG